MASRSSKHKHLIGGDGENTTTGQVHTNKKVLDKSKKFQLNRFQMAELERLHRDEKALGWNREYKRVI